jgi:hypothetical protein
MAAMAAIFLACGKFQRGISNGPHACEGKDRALSALRAGSFRQRENLR